MNSFEMYALMISEKLVIQAHYGKLRKYTKHKLNKTEKIN